MVSTELQSWEGWLLRWPIQLQYLLELKSPSDSYEMSAEKATSPKIMSPSKEPLTDKDGEDMAEKGTDIWRQYNCVATQQVMSREKRVCSKLMMNELMNSH